MHMTQKSELAELSEVSKFYHQLKNAKIYLPSDVANEIEKYYQACFWVADIHRKYGGISKESRVECSEHVCAEKELAPKIEKEIIKLLKEVQA